MRQLALSFKIEPAEAARGELLGFDRIVEHLLLLHRNQHVDVPREQQDLNLAPQFLVQRSTYQIVDWVIGKGFDSFGHCFECLRPFQACQQREAGTLAVLPFLKDAIARRRCSTSLKN